jgi:hypothetical protein
MNLDEKSQLLSGFGPIRVVGLFLLTLLMFNAAFLLIRVAGTFLPKQPIAQEVIRGLSAGTFSISEYPEKQEQNPMIGLDQWTDCLSFELALVGSSTIMTEALAPRILIPPTSNRRCSAVVGFVSGSFHPSESYTYTRFWHGYSTVMSAMLQVMPLGGYRGLLTMLCYGGVAFAGFCAAMRGRETLLVLLPLLVVSFAASEIDQLGALVSHSPAFISIWAMAGLLLLLQNRLNFLGLLLFALSFGAVEAFLDAMILCPLSASVAIIFANVARLDKLRRATLHEVVVFNLAVVFAWCFGFLGSYLCKLGATIAVMGFDPVIAPFIAQLKLRMSPAGETPWSFLRSLGSQLYKLDYGNYHQSAAKLLMFSLMVVGWVFASVGLVAATRAGATRRGLGNGAGFITAALFILCWFALFREHTILHSWFMVRVTIIWTAGGWCWFLAQRLDPALRAQPPTGAIGRWAPGWSAFRSGHS